MAATVTGSRYNVNLQLTSIYGYNWTSNIYASYFATSLDFKKSRCELYNYFKSNGFPVRSFMNILFLYKCSTHNLKN